MLNATYPNVLQKLKFFHNSVKGSKLIFANYEPNTLSQGFLYHSMVQSDFFLTNKKNLNYFIGSTNNSITAAQKGG